MTRRGEEREALIEAYVQRVVATFPPFSESDKRYLSRLLTPPRPDAQVTRRAPKAGGDRGAP